VRCEPTHALDGGNDGLALLRALARQAIVLLRPGGRLLVEIGFDQGEGARRLAASAGFKDVRVEPDLAGLDRILVARTNG
jgi:release factor glutamine methyltransferase